MKLDKNERTPYIMKTSQHFNEVPNHTNKTLVMLQEDEHAGLRSPSLK